MIAFDVRSNVKEFVKHLDKVQRKQIPFATSRAINLTARDAQKDIINAMPATFNVTKKWWMERQPTGIKYKGSDKTNLEATIYTLAYFMRLQEHGGTKRPFKGRGILVPTVDTPKSGRKARGSKKLIAGAKVLKFTGRGRKASSTVGRTGSMPPVGKKRKKRKVKRTRPELTNADPIATMPSGTRGVFRRKTKKRLPIQMIYTYTPRAQIKKRMGFERRALAVSLRAFDRHFARELAKALATAK